IDEYGSIAGMVTLKSIIDRLFAGNGHDRTEGGKVTKRKDGSYLIDAMIPVDDFCELFGMTPEDQSDYNTLAGMILSLTGQIPKTGDIISYGSLTMEVVDMDGKRIDTVLVKKGKIKK
ncbi:MAG: transporter associated domain-containing protein, partial [Spirochaetota bacterium]